MEKVTFNRKRGLNRGKPRLWIEGKHLIAAGFNPGDRWTLVQTEVGFNICADSEGKRKIVGKGAKPIVDITGANLGEKVASAATVKCEYEPESGLITVTAIFG